MFGLFKRGAVACGGFAAQGQLGREWKLGRSSGGASTSIPSSAVPDSTTFSSAMGERYAERVPANTEEVS